MTLLPALLSHYRRHPLQLVALVTILAMATGLWTGVWELTRQARDSMQQAEQTMAGQQQVVRTDDQPVSVSDFVQLRRQGVCVAPWLEVSRPPPEGRVVGIDALAMGCFKKSQAEGDGERLEGRPFMDIAEAVAIADQGHDSRLRLLIADHHTGEALPATYHIRDLPGGLATGELADSFLLNLDALCVLVLLIAALLVRSVYNLGLAQRRAGLSLLHRFGVRQGRLRAWLVAELVVLALLAAAPGILLGQLLARWLGQGFGQAMTSLFDVRLYADDRDWMSYLLVLTVILLVALWCALDVWRRPVRGPAPARIWPGLALMALGVGLAVWGQQLWLVFVAIALVLAGTGWLTPLLLSGLVRLLADRARDPLALWSRRELGVMIRRLTLPAVALQFATAMVIAVHALVTTFEASFLDWLDQRLQGDYYIELPAGASMAAAERILDRSDAVSAWHPVRRGRAQLGSESVDLLVLPPDAALLAPWSFLAAVEQPWQALAGEGVMVNEQLALRRGLAPGDTLALTVAGESQSRTVVAVYADYGRPTGEILLPPASVASGWQPAYVSLTLEMSTADLGQIRSQLASAWGVDELSVRDNAQVRSIATGVFRQTFVLTQAISVLTLVLAGLCLLLMGWVFFAARQWYYQLIRVWGLPRRRLYRLLCGQGVALTLLVATAALLPGIFLTWALVARINPLAFGWSLPMAVYPLFWLQLLALCGLIGLVIAGLVIRQSRSRAPAPMTASLVAGAER